MKPSEAKPRPTEEQSRNIWINKDEPTDVSSMSKHKDDYEDILDERKHTSDIGYCLKNQKVPKYKYNVERSPADIKSHVLKSDRVKYAINSVCAESGRSQEDVRREVISILDEMAHNLNLRSIRFIAYALIKVFKALYNRVYVNEEGIQRMRKLIQEYPVMLMPTHRSYLDFLLVSYVFFHYELPVPAIAAAMDFSNMKFVGWLLQQCGAFYIRRTFGTDKLYWAAFTEYLQTQIRNGDAPIEFFVEGTRSRTSKSLIPKIGMLSATLESYFKAEVPDVMIVPISISYDRIIEESIYAYELLGIPKPKESTSGLLKARGILDEDFGSVHFYIGEAISIRNFSVGKIDRVIHSLEPRYINSLTSEEKHLTQDLATHIVRQQQKHMVISPWALMATVLMQSREGIDFKQLVKETDWLKRQASNLGAYVDWPGNASTDAIVKHYLGLHTNIVSMNKEGVINLVLVAPIQAQGKVQNEVMLNAASNLILGSYRNHVCHIFVRIAMVTLGVNSCNQDMMSTEELFQRYEFLQKLLSKEFVFQKGESKQEFDKALSALTSAGGLTIIDGEIQIKKSINKSTTFYSQMFEPFLLAYWILCQHLLSQTIDAHGRSLPKQPKEITKATQQLAISLLQDNYIRHFEVLSLDIIGNGLNSLISLKAMYKDKRNEDTYLSPNHVAVSKIADEIGKFIELPNIPDVVFSSSPKGVVLSAKL